MSAIAGDLRRGLPGARALAELTVPGWPGQLVEIEAVAVVTVVG